MIRHRSVVPTLSLPQSLPACSVLQQHCVLEHSDQTDVNSPWAGKVFICLIPSVLFFFPTGKPAQRHLQTATCLPGVSHTHKLTSWSACSFTHTDTLLCLVVFTGVGTHLPQSDYVLPSPTTALHPSSDRWQPSSTLMCHLSQDIQQLVLGWTERDEKWPVPFECGIRQQTLMWKYFGTFILQMMLIYLR